ncbi:MAG: hypothetical protein ACP5QG_04690 [candidate division WOR-3 bacterium]
MFVLLILSQTQLQITGSGGFRVSVPSEWSFYQRDADRFVVSGPAWGFGGIVRSGQFGIGMNFLTAGYGTIEVHDNETGDVQEIEDADVSRTDFSMEGRFYPSEFYLGFLFNYHSEEWAADIIWRFKERHSGNSFGLVLGYEMPPKHMGIAPFMQGSLAYTTATRKITWGQASDTDDGQGARFAGEVGLAYYYKPIYLNLGFMGQGFVAEFGDDSVTSHSNMWGLFFGAGAYF